MSLSWICDLCTFHGDKRAVLPLPLPGCRLKLFALLHCRPRCYYWIFLPFHPGNCKKDLNISVWLFSGFIFAIGSHLNWTSLLEVNSVIRKLLHLCILQPFLCSMFDFLLRRIIFVLFLWNIMICIVLWWTVCSFHHWADCLFLWCHWIRKCSLFSL